MPENWKKDNAYLALLLNFQTALEKEDLARAYKLLILIRTHAGG